MVEIPVGIKCLRPRKASGISLTLREGGDQYPSSAIRQRERERMCGSLPYPQLIGQGPPTLGRAICFPQSTDSDAHLIRNNV